MFSLHYTDAVKKKCIRKNQYQTSTELKTDINLIFFIQRKLYIFIIFLNCTSYYK